MGWNHASKLRHADVQDSELTILLASNANQRRFLAETFCQAAGTRFPKVETRYFSFRGFSDTTAIRGDLGDPRRVRPRRDLELLYFDFADVGFVVCVDLRN